MKVYERGCAVMELCLQPAEPLPDGDVEAVIGFIEERSAAKRKRPR